MVRKALEVLTAFALFAVLLFVTYHAWTRSGPTPPIAHPVPDAELQASPPSNPPVKPSNPPLSQNRDTSAGRRTPSAFPIRLPGLDDRMIPEPLVALLKQWETPVIQAHVSTSMDHAGPEQRDNIALTARRLAGTVIRPGAAFSFIYGLGPFDIAHGYGCGRMFVGGRIAKSVGGGVCQVASTLYNAVVLANLKVLERHPHSLTVPYLPPGQDATISGSSGKDFRFLNDTPSPVVIWSTTSGAFLHIWMFGRVPPPAVAWRHKTLGRTPFKTIREPDASLPDGEVRLESPGQPGVTVRSALVVRRDRKSTTRELGTTRYLPSPRVVRVGGE